jgi:hypothetical protein
MHVPLALWQIILECWLQNRVQHNDLSTILLGGDDSESKAGYLDAQLGTFPVKLALDHILEELVMPSSVACLCLEITFASGICN